MRLEGWPETLATEIENASVKEFQYGTFDCCIFAADTALALTGYDFAESHRGYTTKEEADAIIAGYGSMQAMVTALVGDPVHPSRARRGDFVLSDLGSGDILGICLGVYSAFPQAVGLTYAPTLEAAHAWRID